MLKKWGFAFCFVMGFSWVSVFAQDTDIDIDNLPRRLDSAGESAEEVILELEAEEAIPFGGDLSYQEDFYSLDGTDGYVIFSSAGIAENYIMSATVEFNPSEDILEYCGIFSQVTERNTTRGTETTGSVDFAVARLEDGTEGIFLIDFRSDTVEATDLGNQSVNDENNLLIIVQDGFAYMYVNGRLEFRELEIDTTRGGFGIFLFSDSASTNCIFSNIWVYNMDNASTSNDCIISASNTANKRSGPGTDFDRAGSLVAGTEILAIAQATDNDGFIWYQLEDETWVREDVVNATGNCRALPEN
jgi:hypothetical protein